MFWKRLLALLIAVALAGCRTSSLSTPPPATPPPGVRLDVSGAQAMLDFCQAMAEGRLWDEEAVRRMTTSPPYQALIAHHHDLDAAFTAEAFTRMLLSLQTDTPFSSESARLTRIHRAYQTACTRVTSLLTRLKWLGDPALVDRATERAQTALPPQARLDATVYVLLDGRSPAYAVEDQAAIVLDLLQVRDPAWAETMLAHELHHIGVASLLPPSCPESGLGAALETLTGMALEGAAIWYVDGWRGHPTQADFMLIEAFLRDALRGQLTEEQLTARKAELVRGVRGPLYRVGNRMIAEPAEAQGDAWVKERLGYPVELLRAGLRLHRGGLHRR
jgi:hypothetical protein